MNTRLFQQLQHSPATYLSARLSQFFAGVTEDQLLEVSEIKSIFLQEAPRPYYMQKILIRYLEGFKFFQKIQKIDKKMLTKCSQLVKYEFYTSGKTIYHADGNVQLLSQKTQTELQKEKEQETQNQIAVEQQQPQKQFLFNQALSNGSMHYRSQSNISKQSLLSKQKNSIFSQEKQLQNSIKATHNFKRKQILKDTIQQQYASFVDDFQNYFIEGVFRYDFGNILNKGDAFGDKAFKNQKQSISKGVLVLKDVHLLYLDKKDYENLLKGYLDMKSDEFVQFLKTSFFHEIPNLAIDILEKYGQYFSKDKKNRGTVLFSEGEPPYGCYLIKKGTVQIFSTKIQYQPIVKGKAEMYKIFSKKQLHQEKINVQALLQILFQFCYYRFHCGNKDKLQAKKIFSFIYQDHTAHKQSQ